MHGSIGRHSGSNSAVPSSLLLHQTCGLDTSACGMALHILRGELRMGTFNLECSCWYIWIWGASERAAPCRDSVWTSRAVPLNKITAVHRNSRPSTTLAIRKDQGHRPSCCPYSVLIVYFFIYQIVFSALGGFWFRIFSYFSTYYFKVSTVFYIMYWVVFVCLCVSLAHTSPLSLILEV